ncbi:MAG: sulfatase-like hydrolase/transferase [Rikenellaceae bacterium]
MNSKFFIQRVLTPTLLALPSLVVAQSPASSKPDILFIFVDDMTYDGLNALGNRQLITPNMDKIVDQGVSFVNNYNMGGWNGAISQASRTQLITGMYVWNAYQEQEKDKFASLTAQRATWPQVMEDAGYKTFHTGKWHMWYLKPGDIFTQSELVRGGMPSDHYIFKAPTNGVNNTYIGYERPLSRDDESWQPWDTTNGGYWVGGKHWSEEQADVMIGYIEENRDSEQPLFMTCAFNAPHDPRQSPKEFVDMYDVDKIDVPSSFQPEHPYMEEMGCGKTLRDEELAPWPRTEYAIQKHRQEYYALISHLDVQVGRILKALEESGRADNTLIVFSADNGIAIGKHGLMGKQSMYDHSLKVPLVFAGCGLPQGETRTQLTYMQDLVPTVLEIAGVQPPESMDFVSELNIAKDGSQPSNRESLYGAYLDVQRMVRNQRYKLLLIPKAHKIYLFDLQRDPQETKNLYGKSRYQKEVDKLVEQYIALSAEVGDIYDITSSFPELFDRAQ